MIKYTSREIYLNLKKVGLKRGDTVLVCPQLYTFGELQKAESNKNYYKIFFDTIKSIISPSGTICITAYSFQTARHGENFYLETTKCTSGEFSEYIRKLKGSLRSVHPSFSVCAIGKNKKKLCLNNSNTDYGYDSPFERMIHLKAKVLNLGMEPGYNPFQHVAEFLYGVPYRYNKLLNIKCFKKEKKIKKQFFSFARYLDLNWSYNMQKVNKKLKKEKIYKEAKIGSGKVYCFYANDYLKTVLKLLKKNPHILLDRVPNYKKNKIPYDGKTFFKEK
jgi:aminoglycoside 3-N-acetyltransferase|tara:strand:- start:139 stop:966 length:828 start_codon:yes stop_codon:yes gene_type:complete